MDKKALRKQIREQKLAMTPEQIIRASNTLVEKFLETDQYKAAKTVYAYLPYNQEVRTELIVEKALRDGKRVAVPKIYGDEMRFIYIDGFDRLENSSMGIPEPIDDEPVAQDPTALVLMPGIAFDAEGHRVGYGGGYYDKYLGNEPGHPTVALCYDFQMLPQLDTEEFDIPVDLVLWAKV